MRVEYEPSRDLLYIYFMDSSIKVKETVTIKPGVYADFSRDGKLIGIEILDASEIISDKIEFKLPAVAYSKTG